MGDRSQDQKMKDMGGDGQQTQAGRDSIALQNSQMTIHKSFIALVENRPIAPDVNWKLAQTILKDQQATIEIRLRDSLFGLAEVDAVEVKAKRQEDSSALALESVKSLSIDGIEVGTIDSQAPIISTYARKDVQGKLLILGTPGAGKTITLLKLAEQLVDEAIENPETIIPVIFELSTWRDGQSIETWLIEQLYDLYGGKRERQVYEAWLEQRVLLPLLDGLDELGMVRQKACTEKVNEFAKQYPQVVVCCRVKEFQQAGINLSNLRGKVQLQPLNDRQLEQYLQQMGKMGLWEQIQTVPEMRGLLEPVIDLDEQIQMYLLRREKLKLWEDAIQAVQEVQHILPSVLDLTDISLSEQLERQIWINLSSKGKANLWYSLLKIDQELQQFLELIASRPERFIEPGLLRIPLFIGLTAKNYYSTDSFQNKEELFKYYIEKQLSRDVRESDRRQGMNNRKWAFKAVEKEPTREEVQRSLVWLARQMQKHNQIDLVINQMQPTWLTVPKSKRTYRLISGLVGGLIFGGSLGLLSGNYFGIIGGFMFPLYAFRGGLDEIVFSENSSLVDEIRIGDFLYTGFVPIQYLCLRLVLTFSERVAPWNLAQFLTYCHERRLLQQIGGRYRFIHRELLEHFARIEN